MTYGRYYGRLLRDSARSVGKGLALPFVRRKAVRSGAHQLAYPVSTYAPWQADEEFERVYRVAKRNTMVDVWRCYELWSLLGELQHVPGAILEVGVRRGGSGAIMARRAEELGIADPVILCDTWEGVVKAGEVDTYYSNGRHEAPREAVEELIGNLRLDNVELLQGVFPEQTGDAIADRKLRLCHIDVDVYQSAKDVFDWAWGRLSAGGVAVFDDYGFPATPGVTKFVDEQRQHDDRLVLHNLNGHGIVIKR
jgi:O-methyltransferase